MPVNGVVTAIVFYASGFSGTVSAAGMVWGATGTILAQGQTVTLPNAGGGAVGGQAWHTSALTSPVYVAAGTPIQIGWWRAPGGDNVFSITGSGSYNGVTNTSGTPGNFTGPNGESGQVGAYIIYTPVTAPTGVTAAATAVTTTTATLNGIFGDGGFGAAGLPTTRAFLYSTSPGMAGYVVAGTTTFSGTGVAGTASLTGLAPNTTYYYQADVSNVASGGHGVLGAILSFTTNGLPNAPTLTGPSNGGAANLGSSGVTFTWTYNNGGASGAQLDYSLQVQDPSGNLWYYTGTGWTPIQTWITSSAGSVTVGPSHWTLGNGTFLWSVATQDANGKGPYASPFTLIGESAPNAPTLESYPNASFADLSGTPTFAWNYVPNNAVGGQTGWAFHQKIAGAASYLFWNVGTSAWQSTIIYNSGSFESYTFPAAAWE